MLSPLGLVVEAELKPTLLGDKFATKMAQEASGRVGNQPGGGNFKDFWKFHPENWGGRWIQFDLRIFFRWVVQPNHQLVNVFFF